jgi:GT2 family glycosyltransferase
MPATDVSVVVCAYTRARGEQLLAALDSLHRQTRAPDEVLVVVDHNPELLGWLRERATGARVLASRHAPGLAGARNTGVAEARSEVVAFLDDDATAAPTWVERLAAAYGERHVLGVGGAVVPAWAGPRPGWMPDEFGWVVGCSYRGLPAARDGVRNLIGCNMSFRRDAVVAAGGFTHRLGRVAGRPLGCEETELCIRMTRASPDAVLLYDPAIVVHHHVPADRATWRYYLSRCHAEGISKAEVARLAGRDRGLASERTYASRTLPSGVRHELRCALRRRRTAPLARAAAIVVGLGATVAGYGVGMATRRAV